MPTQADIQIEDSAQAKRYSRIRRWLGMADAIVGFVVLLLLLTTGWTRGLRDLAIRMGNDRYGLELFFYVLLLMMISKAAVAGFDFYGFRLERNFGLSNQRFFAWVFDEVKGFLVGLGLGTIVAEIVYALIRSSEKFWWLLAWMVFIALFIFFAQIAPVVLFPIFYKFKPLQNEELKALLLRLSEKAGTYVRGVYEWKLSEKSKKANAALTGLGRTRRIILADTLLQNYSDDEIEAILAHELGHHVRRHIAKSMIFQAAITLLGFWLADAALRYAVNEHHMFAEVYDFANLPLLALVSTTLSFLLMPIMNAWSRHNEREADLYCWQSVPDVAPFVSSMYKLSAQNLSERKPSRIVEVLFHSHPAVSKRIASAEQYASQHTEQHTEAKS